MDTPKRSHAKWLLHDTLATFNLIWAALAVAAAAPFQFLHHLTGF